MFGVAEMFCGALACIVLTYYYATWHYDFWKRRGVFGPKPLPLIGNFARIMTSRSTKAVVVRELYEAYPNEPMVGIFDGRYPALLLRDPKFFDEIFKKSFAAFADRGIPIYEKAEPMTLDLFCLDSERWRPLRRRLASGFASGQLKEMFRMINDCTELLDKHLTELILRDEVVDCGRVFDKYTINVIGTCAFGIDMHALEDENCPYHEMTQDVFKIDAVRILRYWLKVVVPWFYNLAGYVLPQMRALKFFRRTVKDTIDYRKRNNIVRHDFIQQLQQINDSPETLAPTITVTDEFLAAQAVMFFTAGFEASSITLTHAFYELAQHPEIQEKLRQEIRQEYEKNKGTFTYEGMKQMQYLAKVFQETLRKYPPILMLLRKSIETHTFHGTGLTIPAGVTTFVSVAALHHDPKIYPEPHVFDPERFSDEAIASRHPNAFIPFGMGPRMCIGARFAHYVTKLGICKVLLKYKFDVCEKTAIPYTPDPSSFLMIPIDAIYLKVTKLKDI